MDEALPSGLPPTFIRFTHHSYAQMVRVLRRTAARCAPIAKTYSIGRSFNGKELLVIEFSARPGQHELSKPLLLAGAQGRGLGVGQLPGKGSGPTWLGVRKPGSGVLVTAGMGDREQAGFVFGLVPWGSWPHPAGPAGTQRGDTS